MNNKDKKVNFSDSGSFVAIVIHLAKENRDAVVRDAIGKQSDLFSDSMRILSETESRIKSLICSGRGGIKGCHGFISEEMQTGIGNANSLVNGKGLPYVLLDNNGRDDLLINGTCKFR